MKREYSLSHTHYEKLAESKYCNSDIFGLSCQPHSSGSGCYCDAKDLPRLLHLSHSVIHSLLPSVCGSLSSVTVLKALQKSKEAAFPTTHKPVLLLDTTGSIIYCICVCKSKLSFLDTRHLDHSPLTHQTRH